MVINNEIIWEKSEGELMITAYHESAHAVLIKRLMGSTPHNITIKQTIAWEDTAGGWMLDPGLPSPDVINSLFDLDIPGAEITGYHALLVFLAGYVAEELHCGNRDLGYGDIADRIDCLDDESDIKHNDLYKAEKIAEIIIKHTKERNKQIPYLNDAVRTCERELLSHWDEVERLSVLLLQDRELDHAQVIEFFE